MQLRFHIILILIFERFVSPSSCSPILTKFESPIRSSYFNYSEEKLQGVNIGGWLLLEPWITPSIFENPKFNVTPVDEYNLCAHLGSECQYILQNHWDTFITRQDFADMKEIYQLNVVRIPIGYWAYTLLPGDSYIQGQDFYLEEAITWAREYDLKIWIDIHGLPGSQNGFDNSGKRGEIQFFYNDDYQKLAIEILANITSKYLPRDSDVVIGIELANEPFGPAIPLNKLEEYYINGYSTVREISDVPIVIHDAFLGDHSWMWNFQSSKGFKDMIFDFHQYAIFTNDLYGKPMGDIIQSVCHWGLEAKMQPNPVVFGEWSAALTDCTKFLNGVGRPARYEAFHDEGSCARRDDINKLSSQEIEDMTKYIEAQLDAYSANAGWIFWNYKTESSLEWDFKRLVSNGVFPSPPYTERRFPHQC